VHTNDQAPEPLETKDAYDMRVSAAASRQQTRSRAQTRQSSVHPTRAGDAMQHADCLGECLDGWQIAWVSAWVGAWVNGRLFRNKNKCTHLCRRDDVVGVEWTV